MAIPEISISQKAFLGRVFVRSLIHVPLNYDVVRNPRGRIEKSDGIAQAESALSQGKGLVIGFSHFSRRDGIIYGDYALRFGAFRRVPVVMPIAYHQYEDFKSVLQPLAKLCEGNVYPIVIDDTKEHDEYKNLPFGQGMRTYLKAAVSAINQGGIVALSLQGGRKESLSTQTEVLSTLLGALHIYKLTNYVVHFAGISPKKPVPPEAYTDLSGWNFSMRYNLRPGNTYSLDYINDMFQFSGTDDYKKVDKWGYDELAGLVQPSFTGNS